MDTFVCRDVRLNGWAPNAANLIEVNFDTPLSWLIDRIGATGQESNGDLLVKLMCHGLPGYLMCCNGSVPHPEAGNGVTAADLPSFAALRGSVREIELHSCLVARIGECPETAALGFTVLYDGNAFCYQLAQVTGAQVRASIHIQWYWPGRGPLNGLDFGHWNGHVYTWAPSGELLPVAEYPYTEMICY